MYELAVQRSEAPIIFSCRLRHGSNPSVIKANHFTKTRHAHEVTAACLYTFIQGMQLHPQSDCFVLG